MDPSKLDSIEKISSDDFLVNNDFGVELHRSNTSGACEFRNRCREFVDRLVDVILNQQLASFDCFQGLYCFCPELLFEGDDRHVFQLFARLFRVLERCGCLSSGDARARVEEFTTFVVDARTRHRESNRSAEEIEDISALFLLSDYSFMSRRSLVRVLKVCCLIVDRPQKKMPAIAIDLKDCAVPASVVSAGRPKPCVLSPCYKQRAFFTQGTMESVRDAIACSREFMSCSAFDPWEGVSCGDCTAFVEKYSVAFRGSGTSSSCNSPRAAVLPMSSFVLASPRSGSDSRAVKQRTYTAESSLAAILGKRKEVKSGSKKSVSATKKHASERNFANESAKDAKKDVNKSPKVTRSQSAGGSKSV